MTVPDFFQPLGDPLPDWRARPLASAVVLDGQACRLEPLNPALHAAALYEAHAQAPDQRNWTYLSVGPFADLQGFRNYLEASARDRDAVYFAVVDLSDDRAMGTLALLRQQPQNGVIEVGSVIFSPALQRSRIATEAQFLLMAYVFEALGYRRYEWKCDSLNQRSRRAAERLGFRYEGTFRQAVVYKGRNRDTAWFSIIDAEWPLTKAALQAWLDPANFDAEGRQLARLQAIREHLLALGAEAAS